MKTEKISTDVLIIGGGTAGCYAALTISENSDKKVLICEKAHIKRSGCLAAGVNALNAYIVEGRKPQDYVDYAKKDADGIVREDLLLTMSEKLNEVTDRLEKLGLVILKDENGKYVTRGNRNLKINGENIKPILADAVEKAKNFSLLHGECVAIGMAAATYISLKKGNTELKEAIDSVLSKMTKEDFSKMMDEAISVQPLVN